MDSRSYKDNERPTILTRTDSDSAVPINPRRKYKRRGTGEHAEYIAAESEDENKSAMSDSSEHELDGFTSDGELDIESGLPTEERRKFISKKRRRNNIDARIAGTSGRASKQEKEEADKHVARKLMVNAALIGLWYFFSLSISLVRIAASHLTKQPQTNPLI